MTTNFGGVDVVPLLGAVVVCYGGGGGVTTNFGGVDVVPRITQKSFFAIWGLCWYNLCYVLMVKRGTIKFHCLLHGSVQAMLPGQGLLPSSISTFQSHRYRHRCNPLH